MRNLYHIGLYVALAFFAIACGKDVRFESESIDQMEILTRAVDSSFRSSVTPIDFFSEMSFKEWTEIAGIINRFKACIIPVEVLETKTTEALAKSLLHYPLNFLVLFYADPQEAVKLVMDNSNLHQAFVQRSDAAQVITTLFSNVSLDLSPEKSCFDNDYEYLSYVNEMFLEYFIGSGYIPGVFSGNSSVVLEQAAREKLSQREADPDLFSSISKDPLIKILNRLSENNADLMCAKDSSQLRQNTEIIHTFFKQSLTGYHNPELTSYEIVIKNNSATSQFPNAVLRGSATNMYNGHSYAWYDSSLTNDVWLTESYSGIFQLSKYWTNDLYVSCSLYSAEKVYYSSGNHSAIVLPNGKFLSKWDNGPLMEHEYYDCPFDYSNLQYYAERTTPLIHFTNINGNNPIYINQSNTYSFDSNYNMSFLVQMEYNESNYPIPCTLTQINSGSYSLICNDPGYYVMIVEGYRNGICIARTTKDIFVWGSY